VVGTPLYCPRLIGRDRELAALADLARRAAAGETVFAFVSGEAGAGKTRLIEELRRHLPRGMRGVLGTCMEYAPSPMGSVLDIIAALETEQGTPGGAPAAAPTGDDPVDKRRLFERAGDALRRAGSSAPFAMILDDAHWADSVTLDLLQFLIGTLRGARVLVVVAYRTDEVGAAHPLHTLIARAARARHVAGIQLEPLGEAHIHELIDATLPKNVHVERETLRGVRERAEGNPLFAEELLKAAVDRRRLGESAPALPVSLRGLLQERLRRLRPDDVRVLETAALIGRRFSVPFLAAIDRRSPDDLVDFLRRAVDEHYLVEDADELGWFTFRHALTRESILSGVLAIEARAMHLRIAEQIAREDDGEARVVELADHYWRAMRFTECARYADRGGDLAKGRHAYAEAAELYERALACGVADERRLVVLHEKAAAAFTSLGSPNKVLEHLHVAVDHYRAVGDSRHLVEAYLGIAHALARIGQTDRAFAALRTATEFSNERDDDGLRLKCAVHLAQRHMVADEWQQVEACLRVAEPLLPLAEQRDTVRFLIARAALRFSQGEIEEWQDDSMRAVAIARSLGDPSFIALALTNHGVNARTLGRLEAAATSFREAAELGRVFGTLYQATYARLGYVNVLYVTGRLIQARDELLGVLAGLPESTTIRLLVAQFGISLATVLRDDALFHRTFRPELLETAFETNEPIQYAPLAAAVAEYQFATGDRDAARVLLERMLAALPEGWMDCDVFLTVAAYCSQADVERARARFDGGGAPASNAFADAARALFDAYAAARFGSREEKRRHAKLAAARLGSVGMPLLEAEAHELAEEPGRAVAVCERIGALRQVRRLASRAQRQSASPQLTAREREVVDFALRGMSNSGIAGELSLSERTVEAHIAAAYRKLGVRSRRELLSALVPEA
jgi:ATP/maltotriose-dependent transcriptional regulator MalT